ncbi:MAG: gamma carbonic anhydrase family protein [Candidatus Thermoplasmatota archaeon]|jgi:carbonic anhydrase/acetyltransferase-like protein (isoleucine patch superfamily)|nr:gamma carbonic anhydrase family protein [Candidatus Thermoplasmatota archaeon]
MTRAGIEPRISSDCYVHGSAFICGDVEVGRDSSIWPNAVIRGDEESIRVGQRTSVQDCVVVHADTGFVTSIGNDVTIGHSAVVHGCVIEDLCIIGIHSTVLNGCVVGRGSIVGAGAVLTPGTKVPPNSMVLGVPGKVVRSDPSYEVMARENARIYVELSKLHMEGRFPNRSNDRAQ